MKRVYQFVTVRVQRHFRLIHEAAPLKQFGDVAGPVVISSDLAGAKTMLSPGMNGTPEAKLFSESCLPHDEMERIRRGIEIVASFEKVSETGDLSAVKWFHDNGIPQVVHKDGKHFKQG